MMLVGGRQTERPTSERGPPTASRHAKLGRERIESRGRPSGGGLGAAPQAHSRSFIAGTQLEGCLLSMGQKCNGNSSKRPCFTQAATLFRITTPCARQPRCHVRSARAHRHSARAVCFPQTCDGQGHAQGAQMRAAPQHVHINRRPSPPHGRIRIDPGPSSLA